MKTTSIVPAYELLEAPFIEVKVNVRVPGTLNGKPNIERRTQYNVAPSAKKISTYIVNQIFGSDLLTQTEGLNINWLMPTLKEALKEGIYQGESFIYINKYEDKIYLECIKKNEIHDLVQQYDKIKSCKIKQEYKGIFKNEEFKYLLVKDILLENGNTYMKVKAFSVNKKGEKVEIPLELFNQRTDNDYVENYVLPYENIINIDLGQDFFEDSKKELTEEMVIINTIADEIEKTKTRIVTSQHYSSGDIVSNWQPASTHYEVKNLTVGQLQDYFTLLPGDKDNQLFEFLQGDIRVEEYISAYKFYDYQVIQMAGLSPASFGYEKDAYQNTDNINLQKNNSEMTIEAIKTQIEPQINKLIENIIKAQKSQNITKNLLPNNLVWDYGNNELYTDQKKLSMLGAIQKTTAVPYSIRAKIITPILNKLIDTSTNEEDLVKAYLEEEDKINIRYGEL